MLLILKIPMVWLGCVVWWAVKAEPEVAPGTDDSSGVDFQPWRTGPWRRRGGPGSRGPRNYRGGPHGTPRAGRTRRRERAGA
jgi:hypothetical protein